MLHYLLRTLDIINAMNQAATLDSLENPFQAQGSGAQIGEETGDTVGSIALLFIPGDGEALMESNIDATIEENAPALIQKVFGGCGSFGSGTPILMADGTYKPIEQVKPGDWIISRRTDLSLEPKQVLNTISHKVSETYTIELSDGAEGRSVVLKSTSEHPYCVSGRGWVEAGDLSVGDAVISHDGLLTVRSVIHNEDSTQSITVYNCQWLRENASNMIL